MSNLKYKVLFLSDSNGFDGHNPIAWIVKVSEPFNKKLYDECSNTQLGARRSGGHLNHVLSELKALGINSEVIYTGRYRDVLPWEGEDTIDIYTLISGNY